MKSTQLHLYTQLLSSHILSHTHLISTSGFIAFATIVYDDQCSDNTPETHVAIITTTPQCCRSRIDEIMTRDLLAQVFEPGGREVIMHASGQKGTKVGSEILRPRTVESRNSCIG